MAVGVAAASVGAVVTPAEPVAPERDGTSNSSASCQVFSAGGSRHSYTRSVLSVPSVAWSGRRH